MRRADLREAPMIVAETLVVLGILVVAAAVVLAVALDHARA
jgi:hypothetical protein